MHCPQRPKEGFGSPGREIIGDYELPGVGLGTGPATSGIFC